MNVPIYIVDAFCDGPFTGNPAAVCITEEWLSDGLMQEIASENNLSETAFLIKEKEYFSIRWFTPVAEVALAGHPTLAAAHVLFNESNVQGDVLLFKSKSGKLSVKKDLDGYVLNFPTDKIRQVVTPHFLANAFTRDPIDCYQGNMDYMLVFKSQQDIEDAVPDLQQISMADSRGVIITAPGNDVDFVSRYFAPQFGINEDPVTGSAHTTLIPYWWQHFGKTAMTAVQLSKRKGYLSCIYTGERVEIGGRCRTYLKGEISI